MLACASRAISALVAPSRGRGSKHTISSPEMQAAARSPLHGGVDRNAEAVRLKLEAAGVAPSRGRGSKHFERCIFGEPLAGRPFTGAWIETTSALAARAGLWVAPSRGRGSKHACLVRDRLPPVGRPFTGAWIETSSPPPRTTCRPPVAPSRGRGSKQGLPRMAAHGAGVAPSRGRGSKHEPQADRSRSGQGRPFTGAWIETASRSLTPR